jgi:hypothetical protein
MISKGEEGGCQKDDDSCSVSFLIFLPPSPLSVLHTSALCLCRRCGGACGLCAVCCAVWCGCLSAAGVCGCGAGAVGAAGDADADDNDSGQPDSFVGSSVGSI